IRGVRSVPASTGMKREAQAGVANNRTDRATVFMLKVTSTRCATHPPRSIGSSARALEMVLEEKNPLHALRAGFDDTRRPDRSFCFPESGEATRPLLFAPPMPVAAECGPSRSTRRVLHIPDWNRRSDPSSRQAGHAMRGARENVVIRRPPLGLARGRPEVKPV